MHTIKITRNFLFEYQCTSGKFIRLPKRIEKIDSVAIIESNRIETFFARIGMLYTVGEGFLSAARGGVVLQCVQGVDGRWRRKTWLWRHGRLTSSASARTRRSTTCEHATWPASMARSVRCRWSRLTPPARRRWTS